MAVMCSTGMKVVGQGTVIEGRNERDGMNGVQGQGMLREWKRTGIEE